MKKLRFISFLALGILYYKVDSNLEMIFSLVDEENSRKSIIYLGYLLCYTYKKFHYYSIKDANHFSCLAKKTLEKEFPEYKNIDIRMPSDFMRRLGQSIAAASLPESK